MKNEEPNDSSGDTDSPALNTRRPKAGIPPGSKKRAIPETYNIIQVNFCKTPGCPNFGKPADPDQKKTSGAGRRGADGYKLSSTSRQSSSLVCHHCGKSSRLKSNKAVYEEYRRQGSYMFSFVPVRCPDENCENHHPGHQIAARFQRFGVTSTGAPRFRCRICGKTCSVPRATSRQRRTNVNSMVFRLLVNKVALSRILELTGLSVGGLYRKIDFIHRQCTMFAASRESRLSGMEFGEMHLNTDRQDYVVNWRTKRTRRTVQLTSIATTDRYSRYVFGLDINFDPSMDGDLVEEQAAKTGDSELPPHFREFARVWTSKDLENSTERAAAEAASNAAAAKEAQPEAETDDEELPSLSTARDDLEVPEAVTRTSQQLPSYGMQVHAEYLMHGHYHLLADFFRSASKVHFTIDGDSGLLSACMGAFAHRIANQDTDVVQVSIRKDLKIDHRKQLYRDARKWFLAKREAYPELSDFDAKVAILAETIEQVRQNRFSPGVKLDGHHLQHYAIPNPFPDLAEPEKQWVLLTDVDHLSHEDAAKLLLRSTLYPVDTVFNQIRKRVSMAERPVISVRRARRVWHMYSAYDPSMLAKILQIFRVWHNFLGRSAKDGKTPAEHLGLVAGVIRIDHILGFDAQDLVKRAMRMEEEREAGRSAAIAAE